MESVVSTPNDKIADTPWRLVFISSPVNLNEEDITGKENIFMQFQGRSEFVHDGNIHSYNWPTLRQQILEAKQNNSHLLVLCSTDHRFSKHYTVDYLSKCIAVAEEKEADLLLGAINWFEGAVQMNDHLFWVDKFIGFQFVILFRRCYDTLLNIKDNIISDQLLSEVAANKLLTYPFISCVTKKLARLKPTSEEDLFLADPSDQLALLQHVKNYYSTERNHII